LSMEVVDGCFRPEAGVQGTETTQHKRLVEHVGSV